MDKCIHLSVGFDESGEVYLYRFQDRETAETFARIIHGMDLDMTFQYVPLQDTMSLHGAIRDVEEMRA